MRTLTTEQLNNNIRSFRLKRGYMVTFAVGTAGWGYSRCFIADEADMEFDKLPAVLDGKISSYRIFEWQSVKKNGLSGEFSADINKALNSSWTFTWGVGEDRRSAGHECVPHKIHKDWPGVAELGSVPFSAHMKTDNEPANNSDDKPATVSEVLAYWQDAMRTGMRLCSPSAHDGGYGWLGEFMAEIDKRGWRCDIVDIHCYWPTSSFTSNSLLNTYNNYKRPIWISELLWGASWNGNGIFSAVSDPNDCSDYNQTKNLEGARPILQRLNSLDYIERYAWWNGEKPASKLYHDGKLTKLGEYYKIMDAGIGYRRSREFIPVVVINKPDVSDVTINEGTATITWTDSNGDMVDGIRIMGRSSTSDWVQLASVNAKDKTGNGNQTYSETVTLSDNSINTFRVINDFDGKEFSSSTISVLNESGWISGIPINVSDYYYFIYSSEASTDLCWTLGWNGNSTDISYQSPKAYGTTLEQAWQLEKNADGYALRNLAAYDYVMCSPNAWNFTTNNTDYHAGAEKACYLPEYHDGYWTIRNMGHSNCYVGLWDNDKQFAVGERLAANRDNTTSADHVKIFAISKLAFNEKYLSTTSRADYLLQNPVFTWGTVDDGGYGTNTHPTGWNFKKTTEGWNDHNVKSEMVAGKSIYRFNSWAGTFTYAELSQSVCGLPNGLYRLTADLATTENTSPYDSRTAIYGAPTDNEYIGRSYNIQGYGVSDFRTYEVYLQVDDNNMTIGVRSDGTWFKVANFSLFYLGASSTPQQLREVVRGRSLQKNFFSPSGDVNMDLHTSVADLTALIDILGGGQSDAGTADQNGDKKADINDVKSLLNTLFK